MVKMMITLEGQHFKRQYLLYIIEIVHGSEQFYYVGQTGDRNHITARPAFRRLAGHLEDLSSSTQNQIYQYLAAYVNKNKEKSQDYSQFDGATKQDVEDFLVHSVLNMHIYSLNEFTPGIEKKKHLEIVRSVELFEKIVLNRFVTEKKRMINKKILLPEKNSICPYPQTLTEIFQDFHLNTSNQ